jgi:hypothetical protein
MSTIICWPFYNRSKKGFGQSSVVMAEVMRAMAKIK